MQSQSDEWKVNLLGIINATSVFLSSQAPNVMFEVACETNGKCDNDQKSFKGYLARWMGFTIKVAPFTRDLLLPILQASAQAAAKQCNAGANGTTCGLKWTTNGVNDGSTGVGEQMSAMEVMQSLLQDQVAGPVGETTGGVSQSNPSAGSEATDTIIKFKPITTADKVGAGFLTTLVLVGIIGGTWWLVS